MWQAIVFGFLGGLMGANGIPHFFKGIVREEYPMVFGNSPIRNVVAGWFALVIATGLVILAGITNHPVPGLLAIGVGALLMGIFHAGGGAYRMNDRVRSGN